MCRELIEDLLKEKFGFSITEPMSKVSSKNVVKTKINHIPKCYNPLTYLSDVIPRPELEKKPLRL